MAWVCVFQSGGENLNRIVRAPVVDEKRSKDLLAGTPDPLTAFRVIETNHADPAEIFFPKKWPPG